MNKIQLNNKFKLTKHQLSEISGVPYWSIDNYCRGKRSLDNAPLETLIRLSIALNCKIEDLIDDTERIAEIRLLLKPTNINKVL